MLYVRPVAAASATALTSLLFVAVYVYCVQVVRRQCWVGEMCMLSRGNERLQRHDRSTAPQQASRSVNKYRPPAGLDFILI